MKIAHFLPARDKEPHIRRTALSVLAQHHPGIPFEIILSDQGSTDGTLGILRELAQAYNGPAKVRVVECPEVDARGMNGLNVHFDWLHSQTDADLIISTSADDIAHPALTQRAVEAFRQHDASVVGHAIQFIEPGQIPYWEHPVGTEHDINRTAHPEKTRYVTAAESITLKVGGSCVQAWRHDLHSKYGPLRGPLVTDIALAFWGALERGFWFEHEPHYAYVRHADAGNTGLEGARRAAKTDAERAAIDEIMAYQIASTLCRIGARAQDHGTLTQDAYDALMQEFVKFSMGWVSARDVLTIQRINPMPLRA